VASSSPSTRLAWRGAFAAGAFLAAVVVLARPGGYPGAAGGSAGIEALVAIAATVITTRVALRFEGPQRVGWLSLAGITATTALSDAVSFVPLLHGQTRVPFVTAFVPLVGLVCAVVGGAAFMVLYVPTARWRTLVDALILAGSSFLLAWALFVRHFTKGDPVDILTNVSSPMVDVAYAIIVGFLVAKARPGDRPPMLLLLASVVVTSIGDTTSAYLTIQGLYRPGSFVDCLSVLSVALVGIASTVIRRVEPSDEAADDPRLSRHLLPYVVLVLGGGSASILEIAEDRQVDLFTVLMALVLLVLLGVRQFLSVRENIILTERLHARAADLAASERRFRDLVQNSSDVTMVVDPDGKMTFISPSVTNALGYAVSDLVGKQIDTVVHPDDALRVAGWFRMVSRASAVNGSLEFRFRDNRGGYRTVEGMATKAPDGSPLGGIVINTRDITERRDLEEQLRRDALHDPLTGLANRALLRDRISHSLARRLRDGTGVALILVDLDDFKTVNDSLGHDHGDRLLGAIADRITTTLRASDTSSRLGGDEFACLLEAVSQEEAEDVARRILVAVSQPVPTGVGSITVRASIGIAMATDDVSSEDLLRRADVAMYSAKEYGRNRYVVFHEQMEAQAHERLRFQSEMARALDNEELVVYYQPLIDLKTLRIAGAEALVRWQHPTRGLVPPFEFIPLAEQTGMIIPLGRFVLRSACAQVATWNRQGRTPIEIAVNISSRHLQSPEILADVQGALATSGLDPHNLVVELTESALVADIEGSSARMAELRNMGLRIAIDDFGTGYSSLSYLRDLPLDILKIDRAFLSDLGVVERSMKFVRAIHDLARSLDLETIAEGAEDLHQVTLLRGLGVDYGQGFYWSKPVEAEKFEQMLKTGIVTTNVGAAGAGPPAPLSTPTRTPA
jgi:diguanylate cyclase (GGDEF)-like protein/PAS domain S-box-containing protein